MGEMWLVCEGDSDAPVLAAVFTMLGADIIPKPAGGSSNAPSAAEYLARQDESVTVAYVVDRDYNRRAAADATFTNGKRRFMWRRHAIESYLLAPAVIVEAFRNLKASVASNPGGEPAWAKALPLDEAVVAHKLREFAGTRAPEEAPRIVVQRLWEDLSSSAGQIQRRIPATPGAMNPDAATCRAALLSEAARLITKAGETATTPHLTAASAGARYDDELARVSAAAYMNGMDFLEEFHGRDLLGMFFTWLKQDIKLGKLKKETLVKALGDAVPAVYRANRSLYGTDDFLDLANGVRALAGQPLIS